MCINGKSAGKPDALQTLRAVYCKGRRGSSRYILLRNVSQGWHPFGMLSVFDHDPVVSLVPRSTTGYLLETLRVCCGDVGKAPASRTHSKRFALFTARGGGVRLTKFYCGRSVRAGIPSGCETGTFPSVQQISNLIKVLHSGMSQSLPKGFLASSFSRILGTWRCRRRNRNRSRQNFSPSRRVCPARLP